MCNANFTTGQPVPLARHLHAWIDDNGPLIHSRIELGTSLKDPRLHNNNFEMNRDGPLHQYDDQLTADADQWLGNFRDYYKGRKVSSCQVNFTSKYQYEFRT
jgi:hypothetical protein